MVNKDFIEQKKMAIIFTIIVLLVGIIYYFASGIYLVSNMSGVIIPQNQLTLLKNTDLKVTYTPEGNIKLFALARGSDLYTLKALKGSTLPTSKDIVIGNVEYNMMVEEKLFRNIGDEINGLFGIDVRIGGELEKTNTYIDEFHFVNADQFRLLNGDSNIAFIKFKDPKTPKLFYLYDLDSNNKIKLKFSEGSFDSYSKKVINNKVYYPVILGYDEAKMMREEKLFSKPGDTLDDFFGRDVIIVGILEKANSGLDMMHIVEKDFFNTNIKVELL